jgi:hypothetical protein
VAYWYDGEFRDAGFAVPQKLRWAETVDDSFAPRDVRHFEPAFVDLLSFDPVHNAVLIKWQTQWIAYEPLFRNVGKYRLTISASPASGAGSQLSVDLTWTGDWQTANVKPSSP